MRRVLEESGAVHGGDDVALAGVGLLSADAENKRKNRKLYLLLDLDETLIVAKNLEKEPSHVPVGKPIVVQGRSTLRFDLIERPGLQHFLREVSKLFVVFMYTMGDEAYVRAVLDVIDPHGKNFAGGIACWKESEGRHHKYIERVVCDRSMALVVDDMMDYWTEDMPNFILTRRFVGDHADDGLMLLYGQLNRPRGLKVPPPPPPTSRRRCRACSPRCAAPSSAAADRVRGVVLDQTEETLVCSRCATRPLFGGDVTLDVDRATHLVARQKEGGAAPPKSGRRSRDGKGPVVRCVGPLALDRSPRGRRNRPTTTRPHLRRRRGARRRRRLGAAAVGHAARRSPPAARSEPSDAAGRKRPRRPPPIILNRPSIGRWAPSPRTSRGSRRAAEPESKSRTRKRRRRRAETTSHDP